MNLWRFSTYFDADASSTTTVTINLRFEALIDIPILVLWTSQHSFSERDAQLTLWKISIPHFWKCDTMRLSSQWQCSKHALTARNSTDSDWIHWQTWWLWGWILKEYKRKSNTTICGTSLLYIGTNYLHELQWLFACCSNSPNGVIQKVL